MAAGDHPLEVSSRVIDAGESDEATNRLTNELSELADDISIVESFSHVITFRTEDGLVCFDTSHANSAVAVTEALRTWSDDRVHSLVYTHGHIDHVGGSGAIAADAERRDHAVPAVVGHEAIAARFERYDKTNEYNITINARQFGNVGRSGVPLMLSPYEAMTGTASRICSAAAPSMTIPGRVSSPWMDKSGEMTNELPPSRPIAA